MNSDTGKINQTKNQFTKEIGTIPDVAKQYKKAGKSWVVIADEVQNLRFSLSLINRTMVKDLQENMLHFNLDIWDAKQSLQKVSQEFTKQI
jgi:hypothetical protein